MAKTIRGLVYDKFNSLRAFSKVIEWDRTKTSNIINGVREPRVSDLSDMSRVLNIPIEDLAEIFLLNKSQNSDYCNDTKAS